MSTNAVPLPDDLALCHQIIQDLRRVRRQLPVFFSDNYIFLVPLSSPGRIVLAPMGAAENYVNSRGYAACWACVVSSCEALHAGSTTRLRLLTSLHAASRQASRFRFDPWLRQDGNCLRSTPESHCGGQDGRSPPQSSSDP